MGEAVLQSCEKEDKVLGRVLLDGLGGMELTVVGVEPEEGVLVLSFSMRGTASLGLREMLKANRNKAHHAVVGKVKGSVMATS